MNVLILGSGGREHAIVQAVVKSSKLDKLFTMPGNAGTAALGTNIPGDISDNELVVSTAKQHNVDLVIVGPEVPLCNGIVDRLQQENIKAFGPTKAAARLEGDKAYSKELMRQARIPTAEARIFSDYEAAKTYVATRDHALVVKAAGLAAGKGVVICEEPAQALLALEDIMLNHCFGDAGKTVVVEEKLQGTEMSVLALVDGTTIYLLETAQDYKKIGEGNTGLNTGGMGTFSPSPRATDELLDQVQTEVFIPIIDALRGEGIEYHGVLYAGLMLTAAGPKVLEFNCRFGDPETQVILPRIRSDVLELLDACASGRLSDMIIDWDTQSAVCVVMASGGYPGKYQNGKVISGLSQAARLENVHVYHAGTATIEDRVVTSGGRVLGITALGDGLADARRRSYEAVDLVSFDNAYYRKDIAAF